VHVRQAGVEEKWVTVEEEEAALENSNKVLNHPVRLVTGHGGVLRSGVGTFRVQQARE